MEKSLGGFAENYPLSEQTLRSYSALALAYMGDSVYEMLVRTMVVLAGNERPQHYHKKTVDLVSAAAQTKLMQKIRPMLSKEEETVYRRGRNSKVISPAKNQSLHDYRIATGFEALVGYLYLAGRKDRLMELFRAGIGEGD